MTFKYSALHLLYFFIAGSIGALIRFWIIKFLTLSYDKQRNAFPFPHHTLVVNIIACFLLGIFGVVFEHHSPLTGKVFHTIIILGFLGALSTFSTFIADVFEHLNAKKYSYAFFYTFGTLILCLGFGILGRLFMKGL